MLPDEPHQSAIGRLQEIIDRPAQDQWLSQPKKILQAKEKISQRNPAPVRPKHPAQREAGGLGIARVVGEICGQPILPAGSESVQRLCEPCEWFNILHEKPRLTEPWHANHSSVRADLLSLYPNAARPMSARSRPISIRSSRLKPVSSQAGSSSLARRRVSRKRTTSKPSSSNTAVRVSAATG